MDDAERSRVNKKRTCEEGESLRWLNEGMKRIWPMSTEFASTYFFGPMASTFLDKYKPRGSGLVVCNPQRHVAESTLSIACVKETLH